MMDDDTAAKVNAALTQSGIHLIHDSKDRTLVALEEEGGVCRCLVHVRHFYGIVQIGVDGLANTIELNLNEASDTETLTKILNDMRNGGVDVKMRSFVGRFRPGSDELRLSDGRLIRFTRSQISLFKRRTWLHINRVVVAHVPLDWPAASV